MAIRVMIVDDHKIIREGLRALIARQSIMEVCGEAADGRNAVDLAGDLKPDVIVMDLTMPDMNGIEATGRILADNPGTKVIALSVHSDSRFVDGVLKAGAAGYLLKDCAFEEVVRAIEAVAVGQVYLSPGIASRVVKSYVQHVNASTAPVLTAREREVLQMIAEGQSVRSIAAALSVSIKTVESHRQQIMRKLRINSVAGLTRYAIREGITSVD
jgi:two-component system, NarL family, response regulator NreC